MKRNITIKELEMKLNSFMEFHRLDYLVNIIKIAVLKGNNNFFLSYYKLRDILYLPNYKKIEVLK